jgi:carboxyl-terminal processing protease
MLLGGVKALLKLAGADMPADLARRVSAVTSEDQFAALLKALWPAGGQPEPLANALQQGLLQKVPGRAQLLSPDALRGIEQIRDNRYVGTGIQIRYHQEEKLTQLVTPFRGGPAYKAGARPGDLIVEIDGKTTQGLSLSEVVQRLRGDEGTPVSMAVRQPGSTETRTLNMIRSVIPFENVQGCRRDAAGDWKCRLRDDEPIGYVCVKSLTASTLHELRQVERWLPAEGVRALVLDLRFSHGDYLQRAALVADGLLDSGVMWRVREAGNQVKEQRADRDCLFRDLPLVVLINEYSSGIGIEALAAALQDRGRAILVGEKTRGSGYVNSFVSLPESRDMLVIRTGIVERVSPKAASLAKGVEPDHRVEMSAKQQEALSEWLRQKDLTELPAGAGDTPPEDPQLAKAVELLRAAVKAR